MRGKAAFSVRWPPRPFALPDPNMVSLVLRVRWQDRELWLMGDALAPQERDLLDLGDPGPAPHRLLKVGHHGSRNASDPAWIGALAPEVAIIPAGLRNRFEHPHPRPWRPSPRGAFIPGSRAPARACAWKPRLAAGGSRPAAANRPSRPFEEACSPEGRDEPQAALGVVGLPLGLGLGSHIVDDDQGRPEGHAAASWQAA